MARVADLGGRMNRGGYSVSATPTQADRKALLSDWQMVAGDIAFAFGEVTTRVREAEHAGEEEG